MNVLKQKIIFWILGVKHDGKHDYHIEQTSVLLIESHHINLLEEGWESCSDIGFYFGKLIAIYKREKNYNPILRTESIIFESNDMAREIILEIAFNKKKEVPRVSYESNGNVVTKTYWKH